MVKVVNDATCPTNATQSTQQMPNHTVLDLAEDMVCCYGWVTNIIIGERQSASLLSPVSSVVSVGQSLSPVWSLKCFLIILRCGLINVFVVLLTSSFQYTLILT